MVNRMVLNNLGYRKTRTALSVIAVALEVLLILSTVGLVRGLVNDNVNRTRGIGADIMFKGPDSNYINTMGSAALPESIGAKLAEQPHVVAAAPVLVIAKKGITMVNGIDDRFRKVCGGFTILAGRDLRSGLEIIVDDRYAQANHSHVGDDIEMWGHKFKLVGIVQNGKGARLYVPLATSQDLNGYPNKASLFYVRLDDPKNTDSVMGALNKMVPGYSIVSMVEVLSQMTEMKDYPVKPFMYVMIGVSVSVGFLVIFLAMYTAVLERTREIGILKSLGGSKTYIANLILREVTLITLIGIVIGVAASLVLQNVVQKTFPTLTVEIPQPWFFGAAIIAVLGSIVGSLYPAIRAARQDPIAALAYE
jgi:putative ABC transport system permease protein